MSKKASVDACAVQPFDPRSVRGAIEALALRLLVDRQLNPGDAVESAVAFHEALQRVFSTLTDSPSAKVASTPEPEATPPMPSEELRVLRELLHIAQRIDGRSRDRDLRRTSP